MKREAPPTAHTSTALRFVHEVVDGSGDDCHVRRGRLDTDRSAKGLCHRWVRGASGELQVPQQPRFETKYHAPLQLVTARLCWRAAGTTATGSWTGLRSVAVGLRIHGLDHLAVIRARMRDRHQRLLSAVQLTEIGSRAGGPSPTPCDPR